ncbi:hypothetical protein ACUXPM_005563, partial [Ralstonia sp. 151470066-2]
MPAKARSGWAFAQYRFGAKVRANTNGFFFGVNFWRKSNTMTTHKNTTVGKFAACTLTVAALSMGAADAGAVEWSDTSIGYRYGTQFAEPFVGTGIHKNVFNFT